MAAAVRAGNLPFFATINAKVAILLCEDRDMRLDIEDQLISETLRVTGLKTERETVELGLRTLLRLHQREAMRPLRGKLQWEGGFDGLRGTE